MSPIKFAERCALILLIITAGVVNAWSQTGADAELKRGNYDAALEAFRAAMREDAADERAPAGMMRAYLETGRYKEAEDIGAKALSKNNARPRVKHLLGEIYASTGRYAQAVAEFEGAAKLLAASDPVAALQSDLRRAEMLSLTGQEEAARQIFARVAGAPDVADAADARLLTVAAKANVYLEQYKDASDLYLEAIAVDPSYIEAHLGGGELFTEKYNYAEAAEFFQDALKINANSARALTGVAANKKLEGGAEMEAALKRALEINPRLVAAHTLRAGALLEAGSYDAAALALDEAQKINSNSLEAYALHAALLYLRDQDFTVVMKAALAVNPRYGQFYDTLAHYATITRRYHQAVEFARQAVALAPRLWRAHLNLGMALTRTGRVTEGRAAIETAFKGDPFNVWAKNSLDLLDTMGDYKEAREGDFLVKVASSEHDALAVYATGLLKEAASKLNTKYKFTPQGPLLVEFFPNHEDFAVRALGLPGLGALGVCFGQVIALDSPSARPAGEFNWGGTLWHEYTHVITLQMTDYRIPRWFSEGLSVYEERRGRPGWGDEWTAMTLKALGDNRWFKIADLDAGFQQPKTPQDVPLAYFQASQVCEFIVERHGFDAILAMLKLYRAKATTAEVLNQVLQVSAGEFDQQFQAYVREKAGSYLSALQAAAEAEGVERLGKEQVTQLLKERENFVLHLRAGNIYAAENNTQQAITHFKRAVELFPFQATGKGNAYEKLAQLYDKTGDSAAAAQALESLIALDENNVEAVRRLAEYREKEGDAKRTLEALQLAFFIDPFDYALHARAGDLHLRGGDAAQALREFQVALALQPPNKAEANYNLARALHAAGKTNEAKRAVLVALEDAPGYDQAQELLLKISGL